MRLIGHHWWCWPWSLVKVISARFLHCKVTLSLCCLFFSHSVLSDSLRPHGLQHARLPCPSLSPGACLNSCPLSQWCHPTISSSVICPQFFSPSGSFPMSWLFPSGGQSIGASASVLPMNIQGWFPLGLIGLISLQPKVLSRVFSSITVQKHQFFGVHPCLWSNSHICQWLLEKPQLWLYYLRGDTLRQHKLCLSSNFCLLILAPIGDLVCHNYLQWCLPNGDSHPPTPISCFFINWKFIVRKSCLFPFIYLIIYISMY